MTDLIYRLRKRAEIRRGISTRKSVQNNEPDRIADLLEEAADEIDRLKKQIEVAEAVLENVSTDLFNYYQKLFSEMEKE